MNALRTVWLSTKFPGHLVVTLVLAAVAGGVLIRAILSRSESAGASASAAIVVDATGRFNGTLRPGGSIWYRVPYIAARQAVNATITVDFHSDDLDNIGFDLYTGSIGWISLEPIQPDRVNATTVAQSLIAPGGTSLFIEIANRRAAGLLTISGIASPGALSDVRPAAQPIASPTGSYAVTDATIRDFVTRGGGTGTFGNPISNVFTLLGCPVQMFQRLIVQICPGQAPALINMLDPEIFPYTSINGSTFPRPDDALKASTPVVGTPAYAGILNFMRDNVPDQFNGQAVNFWQTFAAQGGLEFWGAVISRPAVDPHNSDFIYQRFQRNIMHYRAHGDTGSGPPRTDGLLLADYLKAIIRNVGVPADLLAQASGSRFLGQYCPGLPGWLCRPDELPGTNLTNAFPRG